MKKKAKQKKAAAAAAAYPKNNTPAQADVLGSYTGNAQGETSPTQDADDL